ncbi:MAG: heparinase II/III family protein [Candidatus Sumerlaeota bacterium]|nr:heparinase II/III family protein [Candidatus Sumerlaeota bacterium]
MLRSSCVAMCLLVLCAGGANAFDVKARITRFDGDKSSLAFTANGQQRMARLAPDVRILDGNGKPLADGVKSDKLAPGADVTLTIERQGDKPVIKAIQLGQGAAVSQATAPTSLPGAPKIANPLPPCDTTGMKPLCDMGKDDIYLGALGGLYPDAATTRPASHEEDGLALAAHIRPLDANGKPAADGRIVLLSIGFSNTIQSFGGFMDAAQQDKDVNPLLTLVNGAHGGRSAFMIQRADDHSVGEDYWKTWVPDHLKSAGVTTAQVQVIWLKETDATVAPAILKSLGMTEYDSPLRQGFPKDAQTLESELKKIVRLLPQFFPNVKMAYLASRSYGGWALREGNREPFSYETGFGPKWLIEKQIKNDPALSYASLLNPTAAASAPEAPWLSWGPYLWANGTEKRKDGFSFEMNDYRENDRLHYSPQGQRKIGQLMLRFFKNDATTRPWFLAGKSGALRASAPSDRSDQSDASDRSTAPTASSTPNLANGSLKWKQANGAKIPIPPAEHPRLYLRAPQAAQLATRLKDPVLQPVAERMRSQGAKSGQLKIEWDALQYLVSKDRALGRGAIESALALMKTTVLQDRQDACRATGRMMVTGAMVYDWLYSLLTPEEKKAFIAEFVRLAKTQECGYPPTKQGSVTGHASEAMIMRDMISAGIAIYDEFPEMYDFAAGRFFREHLPARNWLYNGHAYHQGDSYGPHRYSWDTYPLWIFDRLGAGGVYNPEQRYVPYLWIYTTRPDGQRLRAGDTFASSAPRGQPWSGYMGTLMTASYYGDGYLFDQFQRQGGRVGGDETIFEFLWRDIALQPKSIAALPLSRFFESPFGWMVARTGWDADGVIAEMKINEYNFANHQHLDAGAFQIYYKGALAIDSGLYSGSSGAYGSPHCMNYYWRTIAHNSLLIYDPDEKFGRDGRGGYGNDGGQRLPNGRSEPRNLEAMQAPENGYRTGKTLAHGFGPDPQAPDYTLLQGDLTQAYSKKVKQVTRSYVFLNLRNKQAPAAMIVFDRVVTANPAFRPYWLLHSQEEPRMENSSAVVDCTQHGAEGRLMLDALLPRAENLALEKIGGHGKEFWVFGKNYENDVDPKTLERTSMEPGAWRIESSPKTPATESLFLNVMQISGRTSGVHWPVRKLETDERLGCVIEGPDATWTILFRRDSARSDQPVRFSLAGKAVCRALITDLTAGQWRARREGDSAGMEIHVPEESGAVWIEGKAGEWSLSR